MTFGWSSTLGTWAERSETLDAAVVEEEAGPAAAAVAALLPLFAVVEFVAGVAVVAWLVEDWPSGTPVEAVVQGQSCCWYVVGNGTVEGFAPQWLVVKLDHL